MLRGHWAIEDRLHWIRDVIYDEDRSQIRTASGLATLRNLAISILRLSGHACIAAALRYHARRPDRPLQTLMKCYVAPIPGDPAAEFKGAATDPGSCLA
jgi:hypothetical protein